MDMDGLAAAAAGMLGLFIGAHWNYPITGLCAGACVFLLAKWMDSRA